VDTTQGSSGDLVLLDEWHVRVLVHRELPPRDAEDLGDLIGVELTSCVADLRERLGARATVRIQIDR